MLIGLLADGHILVEGAPGLAKTRAINVLSKGIHGDFHRVQFTPDLLPADLTGTEIYRPQQGTFEFQKGPLFHNLILADEINRSPAKVQAALLEAMAERQITVGQATYPLPKLFMVMATQNPIEQEGTYPLPEAQLDRFLLHVKVDYPKAEHEKMVMDSTEYLKIKRQALIALNKDNVVFEDGSLMLRGHEQIRGGRYLHLTRGRFVADYYLTSVTHQYIPFQRYVTNAEFIRGTGFLVRSRMTNPYLQEGKGGVYMESLSG